MYFMGHPEPASVVGQTFSVFGPQRKKLGGWGADILPGPARFDVDDLATALVKFANGAVLYLEAAWAYHGRPEERVQLIGRQGGAEIYPALLGQPALWPGTGGTPLRIYKDWSDRALDVTPELPRFEASQQARQIEDFVNHLDDSQPPVVTPEEGVIITRILAGIYRSAETGTEVKV
jgi:predicted dehydrogenase